MNKQEQLIEDLENLRYIIDEISRFSSLLENIKHRNLELQENKDLMLAVRNHLYDLEDSADEIIDEIEKRGEKE